MTLGTRITGLRTAHGLSQGDLAEQLGVSRQSVSKWETDASTPDLDKLILLSEFFQVSLDELVKGAAAQPAPPLPAGPASSVTSPTPAVQPAPTAAPASPTAPRPLTARHVLGFILLGVGLLGVLMSAFAGVGLLFLAAIPLVYGILCLAIPRHTGLVIGWLTFLAADILGPYVFGLSMSMVFQLVLYTLPEYIGSRTGVLQLSIAWGLWALAFLLIWVTARAAHRPRLAPLCMGWLIVWKMRGFIRLAFWGGEQATRPYLIMAWCAVALAAVLFFFTIRLLVRRLRAKRPGSE